MKRLTRTTGSHAPKFGTRTMVIDREHYGTLCNWVANVAHLHVVTRKVLYHEAITQLADTLSWSSILFD